MAHSINHRPTDPDFFLGVSLDIGVGVSEVSIATIGGP
jgi:hypothetical protein